MNPKKCNNMKLELLAPAGSLQSFFAAIECGADAVFCGLKTFSARASAKNFTMEELTRVVGYTHKLNKKIYVALNTLIKEDELGELIEVLCELEHLRVDGLIIQDLGLYQLAHRYFPKIPLHASTQMVIHNLAGVKILEKMGFERVVLARELSLSEISHISQSSSLEIEHFVHGALCYSMSGHCLFSSYIDGRSGNRGRCIQPCRRRYHHEGDSGFYFSTSDFSAIELIPDLVNAGVMSLKIEGRMKSPEYVAAVVTAYRTVIDAKSGAERQAVSLAKQQLETAMGRKSSPGFLPGAGGADIVLPKRKGGIGNIIGKVERLHGNTVSFKTSGRIHVGDRLRIQPGNDMAGQGFTVRNLLQGKKNCRVVSKESFVSIPLPAKGKKAKLKIGDLVFMLASAQLFTKSSEACLRQLKAAPLPTRNIQLTIECDEKKSTLSVGTLGSANQIVLTYPVEMIAARTSPLKRETLFKVFSQSGYPELILTSLETNDLPAVVIKPSRLKEIRRDFYATLHGIITQSQKEHTEQRLRIIKDEVRAKGSVRELGEVSQLYVVTDQQRDMRAVQDHPDLIFVFPLSSELLDEALGTQGMGAADRKRVIWDLPSVVFDNDSSILQCLIERAVAQGYNGFRLNNPAHFEFLSMVSDGMFVTGPWLYALNSQAMTALQELGVHRFSLSIEDDKENLKSLLGGDKQGQQLQTVFSPVDLFTSRIAPSIQKESFSLKNDRGDQFNVSVNKGLTITQASKSFSLIGRIHELMEMGCRNFVMDLRGTGFTTVKGKAIMAAYLDDRPIPGTVTLNYRTGLS